MPRTESYKIKFIQYYYAILQYLYVCMGETVYNSSVKDRLVQGEKFSLGNVVDYLIKNKYQHIRNTYCGFQMHLE